MAGRYVLPLSMFYTTSHRLKQVPQDAVQPGTLNVAERIPCQSYLAKLQRLYPDKLNPDIVGLIELQNSATDAAIAALVASINAVQGHGTYRFISTGLIRSDAISVRIIYKSSVVQPINNFALLNSNVDPIFIDARNRPVFCLSPQVKGF